MLFPITLLATLLFSSVSTQIIVSRAHSEAAPDAKPHHPTLPIDPPLANQAGGTCTLSTTNQTTTTNIQGSCQLATLICDVSLGIEQQGICRPKTSCLNDYDCQDKHICNIASPMPFGDCQHLKKLGSTCA